MICERRGRTNISNISQTEIIQDFMVFGKIVANGTEIKTRINSWPFHNVGIDAWSIPRIHLVRRPTPAEARRKKIKVDVAPGIFFILSINQNLFNFPGYIWEICQTHHVVKEINPNNETTWVLRYTTPTSETWKCRSRSQRSPDRKSANRGRLDCL